MKESNQPLPGVQLVGAQREKQRAKRGEKGLARGSNERVLLLSRAAFLTNVFSLAVVRAALQLTELLEQANNI